jgi:hypothetical protein
LGSDEVAAVAAKALPSVGTEDADDALLIDDAFRHLSGIDVIAHDAELILTIVFDVLRPERPRRPVAVGDDERRRNLDVGLGLVLALVAQAVDDAGRMSL